MTTLETKRLSDNVQLSKYVYTLDKVGNRQAVSEVQNGQSRNLAYTYDDLYRLTGETITDATNGNRTSAYVYDKVSNRLTKTVNGTTTAYAYDANDRLLNEKVNGTVTANYTYDNNGSTLTKTENGSTTTYVWNDEKRLIAANVNGTQVEYGYNDQGIRVSTKQNGVETRYLLDEGITANVWEEYSPNGTVQTTYSYGYDLITQTQANQTSYYLVDGLGSTRLLTDAQGQVLNSYGYEAFGETTSQSGTTSNKYQYAGEQFDSTLGDYYLRQRFYDTSSGRFGRMDTYEGNLQNLDNLNKYVYAENNPIKYSDSTGYFSIQEGLATSVILSTLANISPTIGIGIASLVYGGKLPEAIAFGGFGAATLNFAPTLRTYIGSYNPFGGILGAEVIFVPKQQKIVVAAFAGREGVLEASTDHHHAYHVEGGVFQTAYWEFDDKTGLDSLESFVLGGVTSPNGVFVGADLPHHPGEPAPLLLGYSFPSGGGYGAFEITGGSINVSSFSVSKPVMMGLIAAAEGGFSAGFGTRIPGHQGGKLAGAIINGGLYSTWVNMTYGKS